MDISDRLYCVKLIDRSPDSDLVPELAGSVWEDWSCWEDREGGANMLVIYAQDPASADENLRLARRFREEWREMGALLDEPESYMHPEMCRCFIHKMNEILSRRFENTDFQVILSTHSPFMLSDVLSEQVIRMDYDESGKCLISQHTDKSYFAANIHSIMADGFFLNYTIGEQARLFLTEKFGLLKTMSDHRDKLTQEELEEIQAMRNFIGNIGDDLIRMSFEKFLQQLA